MPKKIFALFLLQKIHSMVILGGGLAQKSHQFPVPCISGAPAEILQKKMGASVSAR